MAEEERINKVARCIRALLDLDGTKVPVKNIIEIIKDDKLADVHKLKNKVVEHLAEQKTKPKQLDRREAIRQFVVEYWDIIKDNEHVKTLFFNGYCAGRYKKDKRAEMLQELISLAEGGTTIATAPTSEKVESSDVELRPKDMDYKEIDF